MSLMLDLGVIAAVAGVVASALLFLLYLSLLREVRTRLTWGLFAFSVAVLGVTLSELALFLRQGDAMNPGLQGPLAIQAALLAAALAVLAFTTWLPGGVLRQRGPVVR